MTGNSNRAEPHRKLPGDERRGLKLCEYIPERVPKPLDGV